MIDLGTVRPGATIRIPFSSFDKDDGSSITMTNFAVGDILIYKDGSTTERASTNGYTATTDFDGKTGKHLAIIDLADNTTAGFFAAGSEYLVAIDAVTVDAVTVGAWVARFRIGYNAAILDTTIATLSSQTSFTLSAGPAEDDALNGCIARIHDVASAVQAGFAVISDYTGSSKTVTLLAGTTYTAAATDNISIFHPVNVEYFHALAATGDIPTAAAIADAVWDEDATGHQTGGTFGQAIGDPGADATTIYQSVVTDAAGTNIAADIIAIEAQTDDIGAAGAGLSAVPWNPAWDAEVQSEVTDALNAYDPPTKAETDALLTTALTESYAANGAAPTVTQALMAIHQMLMQFAISGTSVTVKKLDNSTTAFVVTLDSATTPTSAVRT